MNPKVESTHSNDSGPKNEPETKKASKINNISAFHPCCQYAGLPPKLIESLTFSDFHIEEEGSDIF